MIWALLTIAFISRAIRFPWSVLQEMRHPVASSLVSLFPATTMLVAIGFVPWFRPLSLLLFSLGVVLQLSYSAWQSAGLWRGKHPSDATTPGLYLPTVANNFISAMACGALGFNDAGLVFLGAGIFSWLSLEPVILQRLRSHGELPAAMRTSLGIQLAPALVACSAWLSVNGAEADTFAKLLFGYGLLQLLFMLRLMPATSGGQQFCQPVSGDHHAGRHRLCSLDAAAVAGIIRDWGGAAAELFGMAERRIMAGETSQRGNYAGSLSTDGGE